MKKIRNYAEQVGHQVVGNLTRRTDWEYDYKMEGGFVKKRHSGCRHYCDEGGNEYIIGKAGGVVIVDAEGGVI